MRLLPAENAGLFSIHIPPARFSQSTARVLAPILPQRLTRVKFIARGTEPGLQSPLKLSIELGQGPYKEVLATTGTDGQEFLDAGLGGVRTGLVDLKPGDGAKGGLWVVVERLSLGGGDEVVEVEVLSEGPLDVGGWGIGDG